VHQFVFFRCVVHGCSSGMCSGGCRVCGLEHGFFPAICPAKCLIAAGGEPAYAIRIPPHDKLP
jgi:hypothetical protein